MLGAFDRGVVGRVLRGQPFFGTRRQQLSYRVMLVQGFLVAVLFGVTVGVDLFYVMGHLLRQQAVPGASAGFTMVSVAVATCCICCVCWLCLLSVVFGSCFLRCCVRTIQVDLITPSTIVPATYVRPHRF